MRIYISCSFEVVLDWLWAFQIVQKLSRLSGNFPNCPGTFQTVLKLSSWKWVLNVSRWGFSASDEFSIFKSARVREFGGRGSNQSWQYWDFELLVWPFRVSDAYSVMLGQLGHNVPNGTKCGAVQDFQRAKRAFNNISNQSWQYWDFELLATEIPKMHKNIQNAQNCKTPKTAKTDIWTMLIPHDIYWPQKIWKPSKMWQKCPKTAGLSENHPKYTNRNRKNSRNVISHICQDIISSLLQTALSHKIYSCLILQLSDLTVVWSYTCLILLLEILQLSANRLCALWARSWWMCIL